MDKENHRAIMWTDNHSCTLTPRRDQSTQGACFQTVGGSKRTIRDPHIKGVNRKSLHRKVPAWGIEPETYSMCGNSANHSEERNSKSQGQKATLGDCDLWVQDGTELETDRTLKWKSLHF